MPYAGGEELVDLETFGKGGGGWVGVLSAMVHNYWLQWLHQFIDAKANPGISGASQNPIA